MVWLGIGGSEGHLLFSCTLSVVNGSVAAQFRPGF